MLQHLFIKDLAVVSHVDISFFDGMTVITGETGAGKSILLDALSLCLGERSDSHMIRPGAEKAEIAATFDITSLSGAILWLSDLELCCDDSPQQCVIRRILYTNGRSKSFINGRPATSQQLRLLGEYLVQIHGQHQHQLLLKAPEQLRLLDAFGQHDAILSQVKTTYKQWEMLKHQLHALKNNTLDQAKIELLQYQIAEFETLNLQEKELPLLYSAHDKLAHAQQYIETLQKILSLLNEQEEGNVMSQIAQCEYLLRPMKDKFKALKNVQSCLEGANVQLQEAVSEIHHFVDELEIDPEKLHEVAERLNRIHEIARKHKVEPEQLLSHFQHIKAQVAQCTDFESQVSQLEQQLSQAKQQYQKVAQQLSQKRAASAKQLAQEITACIQPLGMQGAVFAIELNPHENQEPHLNGNESVVFAISANPGHPALPLNKVVSGGELSRISLALELISAKYLATPCLIFDEVDVGISGKVGQMVGKALYDLSQSAQVLCITHLAQVAAFGDHHLQVIKTHQGQNTSSDIQELNETARIAEIARMMGTSEMTAQAKAHAKQLLKTKEVVG